MAAALSLAGLGAGGGMAAGGKNVTCGVCQEVYRSPRFLPCFHTFCQYCVEGLSRAHHNRPFPCPTCRKLTTLPPGGTLGLQVNFYITDEELQQARDSPRTTPCRRSNHDGQALLLYCEQCKEALCMVCKMTKHENHPTSSLVEVAARCQRQLVEMQGPLEDTIRFLTERSAMVNDSLQDAQAEGERVKERVKAQHARLVATADSLRDAALVEVDGFNLKMKDQLSADASSVQRELDSLLQLGQRVQRAIGDASDAETVEVEREMREGRGTKEYLQGIRDAVPHTTARPGLNVDPASLADDAIRRFLGSPVEVKVPLDFKEVMVPVYQCGQEGACRQVHHLRPQLKSLDIAYGRNVVGHGGKRLYVKLTLDGNLEMKREAISYINFPVNDKLGSMYITRRVSINAWIVSKDVYPSTNKPQIGYDIRCDYPIAFDVKENTELCAVVEEKRTIQTVARKPERNVLLFRGCAGGNPVLKYKPPNADFHPTDVCFWSERGEVKLLVADSGNDTVHVVHICPNDTICD